jgi:F-type H+-transporting ATPase subunit epsilon
MSFKLTVVSPQRIIYENEEVDLVVLPAELGRLGVLEHHTPLLALLRQGKVKVKKGSQVQQFDITSGFVEVLSNQVTVLTSFIKENLEEKDEE